MKPVEISSLLGKSDSNQCGIGKKHPPLTCEIKVRKNLGPTDTWREGVEVSETFFAPSFRLDAKGVCGWNWTLFRNPSIYSNWLSLLGCTDQDFEAKRPLK